MKNQVQSSVVALMVAFAMLLVTVIILVLHGVQIAGLAELGFGSALTGIICTIGGITPPFGHAPEIKNSPGATISNPNGESQKDETK